MLLRSARLFLAVGLLGGVPLQPSPGAREMFARPLQYCGIHYWLQAPDGTAMTERRASATTGPFTVHLRNNIGGGFLTVWDLIEGRELTPGDGRWSGVAMSDDVYVVPGRFAFGAGAAASHLGIVWARSQTEVAHSAEDARARLRDMPAWMPIVRETEESPPGAAGTYVVNRRCGGVVAEIVFGGRSGRHEFERR